MEFIQKNIHMDRVKCRANYQLTLEDDVNVPDKNPDIAHLVLDRGDVEIEEIRPVADHVHVRGRMAFSVLYLSEGREKSLFCMEGKLPIDEQIYMEGVTGTDLVNVKPELEDLSVSLINSRKISVQALVNLELAAEELYDEQACVELTGAEHVEYRKKSVPMACLVIQKKDIFRIREEAQLPQNLPNIQNLIWEDCRLSDVTLRPMEEKLGISGELNVFLLYEGEGEEKPVRWYEVTIPVNGSVDCHGMRDSQVTDASWNISSCQVEVRPDPDGESRGISLDMVMELSIQAYEEETVDMITDIYGVEKEITPIEKESCYQELLVKNVGRTKAAAKLKIQPGEPKILQLCHGEGTVTVDEMKPVENGIQISGGAQVQALYVTAEEETPFYGVRGRVPFQYLLEVPGMEMDCTYHVRPMLDTLALTMSDGEEMEAKAVISFDAVVLGNRKEALLQDVAVNDLDYEKIKQLPSIAVYVVKDGDTLWNIGKQYYVPVEQIREMNHLNGDEIKPGDKLLLVK